MTFRFFTEITPWEQARRDLRFTATRTAARRQHALLAEPLRALLARWSEIDQERRDADDIVIDANAVLCAQSEELDQAVELLVTRLLHEADNDPGDPTFRAYFPDDPGDLSRLGLESAIARTRKFARVAREITPSVEVAAILAAITEIEVRGDVALEIREEAEDNVERVALLLRAWKDTANAARRVVESALAAHARQHRLPSGYADAFFPAIARPRRPRRASPRVSAASPA